MIWFDFAVIAVLGFAIYKGYTSGFVMQIAYLAALIFGTLFAGTLSGIILPYVDAAFSSSMNKPITFALAFGLIVAGIVFAGKMATETLKVVMLNLPNRLAGALFAFFKYLFIISVAINIHSLFSEKTTNENNKETPISYPFIKRIAEIVVPYFSAKD